MLAAVGHAQHHRVVVAREIHNLGPAVVALEAGGLKGSIGHACVFDFNHVDVLGARQIVKGGCKICLAHFFTQQRPLEVGVPGAQRTAQQAEGTTAHNAAAKVSHHARALGHRPEAPLHVAALGENVEPGAAMEDGALREGGNQIVPLGDLRRAERLQAQSGHNGVQACRRILALPGNRRR